MQKTYSTRLKQREAVETKISHLSLSDLLPPDRRLVLNLGTRTLSLLTDGPALKLDHFDLGISNVRERGCSLISLASHRPSTG